MLHQLLRAGGRLGGRRADPRRPGIDHLELALRGHNFGGLVIPESAVITEKADDATVEAFRDHLGRHGVKVSGCNVGGADIRTRGGRRADRAPDPLRGALVRRRRSASPAPASRPTPTSGPSIVEHLRRLGDTAASVGITLALETHKGPTQNADGDARPDGRGRPSRTSGSTSIPGNIAYYNQGVDPCDELEQVKHLVRNVHLKDNRGGFEDWYFPAVGDGGGVDFVRVREILDGVGFTGPYTIEIEGIGGEPEPGLEGRQERVGGASQHLRSCGYFD